MTPLGARFGLALLETLSYRDASRYLRFLIPEKLLQDFLQGRHDALQLLTGDDQGRKQADGGQAGVEGQDVALLQSLQVGSHLLFELDPDHQAQTAYFADQRAVDGF